VVLLLLLLLLLLQAVGEDGTAVCCPAVHREPFR